MTTTSSPARPAALALAALALACVTETGPTTEPTPGAASSSTAPPTSPASAEVDPPAPAPAPEPPAPPAAPNAEPATLGLAFHGRCGALDVSTLDDGQVVVRYAPAGRSKAHGSVAWLHRMDERGSIAESLPFPTWDIGHGGSFAIDDVFGRWPEVRVLSGQHGRMSTAGRLHRRVGDAWKQVETVGASTDIDGAWAWIDGSILALADKGDDDHHDQRLAVVLGKGKGPSLAKLRRATKCAKDQFHVSDVAVLGDGTIVAVAGCETTWIGRWAPGETEATTTRVSDDASYGTRLRLDAQGDGFVEFSSSVVKWEDGVATPLEIPDRPRVNDSTVVAARADHAWYARGSKLWRWGDGGWEPVPTPEGRRIAWASGLGFDTPWLMLADGTVAMRTADGSWHDVALPPTPDLPEPPKATRLFVTSPGNAWVEARQTKYKKGSKTIGTKLQALYTSRGTPVPVRCGTEGEAATTAPDEPADDASEGAAG